MWYSKHHSRLSIDMEMKFIMETKISYNSDL